MFYYVIRMQKKRLVYYAQQVQPAIKVKHAVHFVQ
jgi:hypothetical protein